MNAIQLALLIGGLTFALLGLWYGRANRTWTRLLAADDPRLAYDPVRDPAGWARGGRYRVATWLANLRGRDERAAVEQWRVRTLNRFVVWISLSAVAFLVGGPIVGLILTFVRTAIQRYGAGFGLLSVVVLGFIFVYYSAQLGRTLIAFGNGRRPSAFELAVPLGGIVAVLIAMAILPNLDLSKG
jgi:hypothetical protein